MRGFFFSLTLLATLTAAASHGAAIEMKNVDAMAVMVSQGSQDGISRESDFDVLGKDGKVLTHIYPFELYPRHFWSQPLGRKLFNSLGEGLTVRPVSLDDKTHWELRYKGWEWKLQQKRSRVRALLEEVNALWEGSDSIHTKMENLAETLRREGSDGHLAVEFEREEDEYRDMEEDLHKMQDKLSDILRGHSDDTRRIERQRKKIEELREDLTDQRDLVRELEIELRVIARDKGAALEYAQKAAAGLAAEIRQLNAKLWEAVSALEILDSQMNPPPAK